MGTNCYIVWSIDKTAVIIDPGDEGVEIAQIVAELGLTPMAILLTHGHFDHVLGVLDLQLIYNIPVAMGTEDIFLINRASETAEYYLNKKIKALKIKTSNFPPRRAGKLQKIRRIKLGDEMIKVIQTPGHTPGSVCFYAEKSQLLFTGDTIFADGIGDTSHNYSSKTDLDKSIKKILKLKENITVLPGHGDETNLILWKKLFLQNFASYLA